MTEGVTCEKACTIYDDLIKMTTGTSTVDVPRELFKDSCGWLGEFKKRTGIHSVVRHGELKELREQQYTGVPQEIHREEVSVCTSDIKEVLSMWVTFSQFIESQKIATAPALALCNDTCLTHLKGQNKQTSPDRFILKRPPSEREDSVPKRQESVMVKKNLGPKGLDYLTKILNLSLNKNIIPQIWKLAKIIPIPKPNKDPHQGSSYRPISLLSPTAKLLEKIILPYITNNIPSIYHQHGFKTKHSTTTALHQLTNHITTGFNQKKPPHRTITIALDMSQAFDTVNHYTLIEKLINTNTPTLITRFIANYIRGRKAFTQYKNKNSFKKQFKAGVPQGGVLSPTLFNIYMSDLPTPPRDIHVTTYADDITIYSSDKNYTIAQQRLQPYLEDVQTWTKANDLKLNASKTMTTLFTPDPAEYRDELSLQLDNTRLPTIRNPKILGLTFDPKLTFNEHIKTSKDKAEKTINILKALTSTHWGKNKETLTNTYKTVTRPILEYAGTIYAPIISDKQLTALQVTQNQGLRIATGCTSDTNINHIHDETKILPI